MAKVQKWCDENDIDLFNQGVYGVSGKPKTLTKEEQKKIYSWYKIGIPDYSVMHDVKVYLYKKLIVLSYLGREKKTFKTQNELIEYLEELENER